MPSIVAYLRVSTRRQGESGLGLDVQRNAVAAFAEKQGVKVLKEFVEVESGKKADRPQLAEALAFSRRSGSTLAVAKLDRLSRNLHFLTGLMESGVEFLALDNPHANRLTIHILAAVAEWERRAISERTKAALSQAKERGVKLGTARPGHLSDISAATKAQWRKKGNQAARKSITRKAIEEYADLLPQIEILKSEGKSLRAIADELNREGHRTRRGAEFTASTILRITRRKNA